LQTNKGGRGGGRGREVGGRGGFTITPSAIYLIPQSIYYVAGQTLLIECKLGTVTTLRTRTAVSSGSDL
jgi:hypothetical protein